MEKDKLEVIKVDNIMKCWGCEGKGYINSNPKNKCKICEGKGKYNEASYIFIANEIAFSGDTIK